MSFWGQKGRNGTNAGPEPSLSRRDSDPGKLSVGEAQAGISMSDEARPSIYQAESTPIFVDLFQHGFSMCPLLLGRYIASTWPQNTTKRIGTSGGLTSNPWMALN